MNLYENELKKAIARHKKSIVELERELSELKNREQKNNAD